MKASRLLILIRLIGFYQPEGRSQDRSPGQLGAIAGKVLDAGGKPLAAARIQPFALDLPSIGVQPAAYSDAKGEFLVKGLRPGLYRVPASKEDEYYPEITSPFFGTDHPIPEVRVHGGEVVTGVLVRLGPRAERLVGRIMDARTGRPVCFCQVAFYRADGFKDDKSALYFLTGTGQRSEFNLLVPTTKPFGIKVSAPGFRDWYYGTDGSEENATSLRVSPGAPRVLVILLRPTKSHQK